ncbi:hypothetical protein F5887DRAFT_1060744 [Amanita rubescens]|nr:hypothetical protein F5887DRAFT_1060744 [Amanita rubescens]
MFLSYQTSLLRLPKSGNDWGIKDLHAYNISVQFQDAATFFGVDPSRNYKFMRYMDVAMDPVPAEESAVNDFVVCLLTMLGYVPRSRIARARMDIPLITYGEHRHAKTDVCIVDDDDNDIVLLVQEDKRHIERKDPEPQLIAEAIAAFQTNNTRRTRILGLNAIDAKVMAGITMVGSSPTFYKIPVTQGLAGAVERGQFPVTPTVVYAHLPEVARPAHRLSEGMKPLDNRRHILACYELFKQFRPGGGPPTPHAGGSATKVRLINTGND